MTMKRTTPSLFIAVLFLVQTAMGQPSRTHTDMQKITDLLVSRVNNNFSGDLVVFDFTDYGGSQSYLGKHLAGILINQMINAPREFQIVDQEEVQRKGGNFLGKIAEDISESAIADEIKSRMGSGEAAATETALETVPGFFNPSPDKIKGVDAFIEGTFQDMGEYYYLDLKAKGRKKGRMLASASGNISKMEALQDMEQAAITPARAGGAGPMAGPGGVDAPPYPTNNREHVFTMHHLRFELRECTRSGKYLNCELEITSEDRSSVVQFHKSGTKIFNMDGNKETQVSRMSLVDKHSNGSWVVEKEFPRDNPGKGTLTFEPAEEVQMIEKLQINVKTNEIYDFLVEFSGVAVR